MRWIPFFAMLLAVAACAQPENGRTDSSPAGSAEPSAQVALEASDLALPARCGRLRAPVVVSVQQISGSGSPWLIDSPQALMARDAEGPGIRSNAVRYDGLLAHRSGGYLSSPDFTIQCRSTQLMGLEGPNHFVRCRLADPSATRVAAFDVPAAQADCTGIIAFQVQRQLNDLAVS